MFEIIVLHDKTPLEHSFLSCSIGKCQAFTFATSVYVIEDLSPTDPQENCFQLSIKIYIKITIAPTCFGVITIIRGRTV